jgi:L-malate glycosyltransferase
MKRILFLDHTLIVGGAQLALWDHIRHLDRDRFEAQVLCSGDVPALIEQLRSLGVRAHLLDWPRLRRPTPMTLARVTGVGLRLRKIVRREKIDLVVANTSRTAYTAAIAMMGSPVPLIWWVRDFDFGRGWVRAFRNVPRRIICVSEALRAHYGGASDPKFEVVYVGNDLYTKLSDYSRDDILAARTRLGIGPRDVVVGFMGRLVDGKGVDDLLSAVELLREEFPQLRLAIVGTGKGQVGDVEDRLRRRVSDAGLSDIVRFAGYQSEEALYYQAFDIFVLSSRYREAMPTSVIQAMMARKPVIATRTGGTPEIIRHGETGLLIPAARPAALADALRSVLRDPRVVRSVLRDPRVARRLAAAAHDHVMTHHRQDLVTREVEAVYSEILEIAEPRSGLKLAIADAE